MGFLANAADALSDAAGRTVSSKADAWIGSGITKLRTEVVPRLPVEGAPIANAVIDKLSANTGLLSGLAHDSVVEMTGYLSLGADDEARVVFLRDKATFDEAQDALKAATGAALDRNAKDAEEWKQTKAFLLDLLATAGKAAIPLLMAMI